MKHADIAWIALAAGIVIYEAAAPTDQLLSQAVDRYRAKHPFITNGVIFYIAMHLLRQWPKRADPLHQLAVKLNK
jgi:hypothetical protein